MTIKIVALMFFILPLYAVPMAIWGISMDSQGLEFCNPCWLYREKKLCIFSCVFVAIFANITTLPYAIGYWFYKACTIRRR